MEKEIEECKEEITIGLKNRLKIEYSLRENVRKIQKY